MTKTPLPLMGRAATPRIMKHRLSASELVGCQRCFTVTLAICSSLCASLLAATSQAADIQPLLQGYQQQGAAGPFSADAGGRLWTTAGDNQRKCSSCHGEDLRQPGKHATTGKPIEPLAPSVQADRLADPAKVEKWLKRNCKWTFGRECSPQEKGDLISYINSY